MGSQRVLVTGGLGFIGSAVAETFLERGDRVTIIDSMVSNVVGGEYFTARYPGATIHPTPVAACLAQRDALPKHDLVIHAASLVGPARLLTHSGEIGFQIVQATSAVIDACLRWDAPLIFLSSAEVYGRSGVLAEDSDIRVPVTHNSRIEYALGKLTSEAMLTNCRAHGLRSIVIRPFNVTGARQSRAGGFVMPTFVQQALSARSLTVFETGEQSRAFTAVEDLVEFITQYAPAAFASGSRLFNIGNPDNCTSILALAHRVIQLLESRSAIVFTSGAKVYGADYAEAESFDKIPLLTAATALGWRPRTSLERIIVGTGNFYRASHCAREVDAQPSVA